MSSNANARPMIWVLKGLRQGDTAQAMALALQIGGRVESKQLQFNHLHAIPNWLLGARVAHLTPSSRNLMRPPWPDLVVATGRRTATAAVWIKQQSGGHTRIVQIGRPRLHLSLFDLVVTSPQYGLPAGENIVSLSLPFALPKTVAADELQHFAEVWHHLPRPWILGVIGGGKFPLRLNVHDLVNFGQSLSQKAASLGGSVVLLDSPRSPVGALQQVGRCITTPYWQGSRDKGPNPYQAALKLSDHLAVTSDSVSMVSEMLATEKPVWVFRLRRSPLAPTWRSQSGIAAALARMGILHPPRDVDRFIRILIDNNLVADLQSNTAPTGSLSIGREHAMVVDRIKHLLQA
jgi:uncharacterized protein